MVVGAYAMFVRVRSCVCVRACARHWARHCVCAGVCVHVSLTPSTLLVLVSVCSVYVCACMGVSARARGRECARACACQCEGVRARGPRSPFSFSPTTNPFCASPCCSLAQTARARVTWFICARACPPKQTQRGALRCGDGGHCSRAKGRACACGPSYQTVLPSTPTSPAPPPPPFPSQVA